MRSFSIKTILKNIKPLKIFKWLSKNNIDDKEMLTINNLKSILEV